MKVSGLLPLLLLLTLSGCVTGTGPQAATPAAPDPFASLRKNMSTDRVKALVGEPADIKPFTAEGFTCEIWVYRRKIGESVRLVPMGTREVPVTDVITGVIHNVQEPFYERQFSSVIETIELLIFQQQVVEWKRHQVTERIIE